MSPDHTRPMSCQNKPAQAEGDAKNTHCMAPRSGSNAQGHMLVCGNPVSVLGALRCEACGGPNAAEMFRKLDRHVEELGKREKERRKAEEPEPAQAEGDGECARCEWIIREYGPNYRQCCGKPTFNSHLLCPDHGGPKVEAPKEVSSPREAPAARDSAAGPPFPSHPSPGGHQHNPVPTSPPNPQDVTLPDVLGEPLARLHPAAICEDSDHYAERDKAGLPRDASLCLVCAVDDGVTLYRRADGGRVVHERADEIRVWAYEVGAIGRQECDGLASTAIENPWLFRSRWHFRMLKQQEEVSNMLCAEMAQVQAEIFQKQQQARDRVRHELQEAYWASTHRETVGHVASAIALLEEME